MYKKSIFSCIFLYGHWDLDNPGKQDFYSTNFVYIKLNKKQKNRVLSRLYEVQLKKRVTSVNIQWENKDQIS
jgi:hypothetical protein